MLGHRRRSDCKHPGCDFSFEFDLPNMLVCYFAGCMRWAGRFGSQMFSLSCLDGLEALGWVGALLRG